MIFFKWHTRRHDTAALIDLSSGECVRLKNFVVNAEITGNTITTCGVHDYKFGNALTDTNADKNGEGIYIGTSITQVGRGPVIRLNNCPTHLSKTRLTSVFLGLKSPCLTLTLALLAE